MYATYTKDLVDASSLVLQLLVILCNLSRVAGNTIPEDRLAQVVFLPKH